MRRRLPVALAVLVLALAAAGCGGDDEAGGTGVDETTTETTTDGGGAEAGREVFVARCGSCHTLSDAGTTGTIGPELDGRALSVDRVEDQVRNGGGAMPAFEGDLSEEEIQDVSTYVSEASGG